MLAPAERASRAGAVTRCRCPVADRMRIWRRGWWRWSPSRPAIRPSCSTSTSTWRPTSGIDTVKQAELFAQVRETYGIERDDSLKLRDYPTLNHVIGFVRDRTPAAPPCR